MWTHTFTALGTQWYIAVDSHTILKNTTHESRLVEDIRNKTTSFEDAFSRFKPNSLVSAFADATAGTYLVDPIFAKLLQTAAELKKLTNGTFDPAIAPALSALGYDSTYSFKIDTDAVRSWKPPEWSIKDTELTLSESTCFDLGGIAKGYWIDQISQIIASQGIQYYLVDGGGDMYATTKANGDGWKIAIEWPNQPGVAIAAIELRNQGFASSDTYKRRWKTDVHHLINAKTAQSLAHILGASAIAPSAFLADSCTALACQLSPKQFAILENYAEKYHADCLVLYTDNTAAMTRNWP